MGRTVYAEEHLLDYLKSLINETDVYSIGLILGQSTVLSDYVVHLVRTTPVLDIGTNDKIKTIPEEEFNDSNVTSIHDIDSNLVADHAKHVTRMLPGGMCVLGIFIVGPSDCLADTANVQKLETILTKIQKELMSNFYLFGNCNEQSLVLNYNSKTHRYTCKSIERAGVAAKSIDWKFKKKITKWHQLEAHVELDYLLPITDDRRPQTLKRQLQNILINVSEIIHSSLIVIEENARPLDDTLEDIYTQNEHKKVRKSEEEEENKILNVGVYSPYVQKPDPCVKSIVCNASMRLVGQLVCRTLVYQKATIREASAAIKQDILRSLASRLELHWDSLIQEENGSPEENVILHEPPRRVLFELPGSKVTLSEYLFPGEGLQNSLVLLKELLDIDIHESQINKDVEFEADPTEFCCQNYAKTIPIDSSKETGANSQLALYIAGIIVSFIIAAISILVYQLSSKESF